MHAAVNLACKCWTLLGERERSLPDNNDNGSEIAVACITLHVMKTAIALHIITHNYDVISLYAK